MNWAGSLINKFKNKKIDESQFILGLDLGDSTSSICYYDAMRGTPEIIDISGGYGRANVPTTLQYIPESKEWVFGEYAVLNRGTGNDINFSGVISRLGTRDLLDVGGKYEPLNYILSLFLKELLSSCRNINPKAEILGIVVSVAAYMPEEAKEELLRAFALIGYDKKIIEFVSDRECVLSYHYHGRKVEDENILIIDYGSRELRGGVYEISGSGGKTALNALSYLFDKSAGTENIDESINAKMIDFYSENMNVSKDNLSKQVSEQLSAFAYQHKDSIFQKNISSKGVRLYYNFAYPPFYSVFTKSDAQSLIEPYKESFKNLVNNLLSSNTDKNGRALDSSDITTVLCTGGGFEMLWARQLVEDLLPDSNLHFYKNSKAINAYGASIIAAGKLGVIPDKAFDVYDTLRMENDIGIIIDDEGKPRFISIIEKNSFWWQSGKKVKLIINESPKDEPFILLRKRDKTGKIKEFGKLDLSRIPKRPKGASQIDLQISYIDKNTLMAKVKDCGFGTFFPPSGYEDSFEFTV